MLTRSISSRNSRIEHVFVEPSVQRHPSNKTPGAASASLAGVLSFFLRFECANSGRNLSPTSAVRPAMTDLLCRHQKIE
jgi:hypothetical protein